MRPSGRSTCSYGYAVPFDELWAGSEEMHVDDSVVRVMSLDHLLRVKRISARPHDLLDIDGLLALESTKGGREKA